MFFTIYKRRTEGGLCVAVKGHCSFCRRWLGLTFGFAYCSVPPGWGCGMLVSPASVRASCL